jgi:hypothetical protein
MVTKDWITAIVATYGAILSSYLAFREILKERRKIKIILEYVEVRDIVLLIVANGGHRPVKIIDIKICISQEGANGKEYMKDVPHAALFNIPNPEIPKLLGYGESVIYELQPVLSDRLIGNYILGGKVNVSLFDAEGNEYTKVEERIGNAKWGGSHKINKKGGMIT